jgi:GT2 family glycosyltransferase
VEQALASIFRSEVTFDYEVFVVDNHSVDGSVDMIRQRFPQVRLIANQENAGFSKANNMGIRQADGEYVLLLNPDTIIKEDSLQKMVNFMEGHEDAGALGVKMMDGKGHFLPESKRGFPTPFVAFCKMSGLSRLFPRSKRFNYYHLGHLDRNEMHTVDVLSGACMLLRRSVLEKTGLLDEDYFMYGEDIDLSYRIIQAGYRNYYFPGTEIIHFKGESTKKGSFNYVRMFYRAMIIFTRKHLSGPSAKYLTSLLQIAIYLRAFAALVRRVGTKLAWPLADATALYVAMVGIKIFWETSVKAGTVYPDAYLAINVPAYIAVWLFSFYYSGGYDNPVRLKKIPYGIGIGTVIILAIYALLPESLRTSRGMILAGALSAITLMSLLRLAIYALRGQLDNLFGRHKKILLVASETESRRIEELMQRAGLDHHVVGIAHNGDRNGNERYLGRIADVPEMAEIFQVDEIIFSVAEASNKEIMQIMSALGGGIDYKLVSEGSDVILGSHSRKGSGELYTVDIHFHLNQPGYRRIKRWVDIKLAFWLLLLSPIAILLVRDKRHFFSNCFLVLTGQRTFVGYAGSDNWGLPPLKPCIIPVAETGNETMVRTANVAYAKDWTIWMDLRRLVRL